MQHDANEMTSCLLDSLHEDLNGVKKKKYLEDPSAKEVLASGLSESQLSRFFKDRSLRRDSSIIRDAMTGQFITNYVC
jgi:ubiquitin C-terminal hydrolase